jgi:alanine racemase
VKPDGVAHLVRCALRYKNIQVEGLMSHLADADGKNPSTIERAVAQFDDVVEVVRALGANPSCIHIAQTGGSVAAHSRYANTMRLGIGLYGINPFSPEHSLYSKLRGLRPSLKFIGTITKVIDLKKGDRVSYNYTFTAPKDMTIGILPAGYYEGINRALSNVGEVKIGGHFVPIIGRVCMNHTMISLEGVKANVGDEVVIYSNDPKDRNSIDAIAVKYGLFNYNVLTALSPDVRRILVK